MVGKKTRFLRCRVAWLLELIEIHDFIGWESISLNGLVLQTGETAVSLKTEVKTSLYETDYFLWLEQILDQLTVGDFTNIDLANLIEEIQDFATSENTQLPAI
jgi:hypothetical protein